MKAHVIKDKTLREAIQAALRANDWYCPCVVDSKNKPEYKCMCEDFLNNIPVGSVCHCGLYIKDEQ